MSPDSHVIGIDFDGIHNPALSAVPGIKCDTAAPFEVFKVRTPDAGLVIRIQIENAHSKQFLAGVTPFHASCVVYIKDAPLTTDPKYAISRVIHTEPHHL